MSKTSTKIIWDKDNAYMFTMKFMRKSEADMVQFIEDNLAKGIGRNTLMKQALREYMERQEQKSKEENKTE